MTVRCVIVEPRSDWFGVRPDPLDTACRQLLEENGWAGPSRADDLGPTSNVPVREQAPPDQEPGTPKPGSHVHDVQPAPERSGRETFEDIWPRDKLTGDWGGGAVARGANRLSNESAICRMRLR